MSKETEKLFKELHNGFLFMGMDTYFEWALQQTKKFRLIFESGYLKEEVIDG